MKVDESWVDSISLDIESASIGGPVAGIGSENGLHSVCRDDECSGVGRCTGSIKIRPPRRTRVVTGRGG